MTDDPTLADGPVPGQTPVTLDLPEWGRGTGRAMWRRRALTAGGVAEKSGIKGGDFIVEIAGQPTPNITAYMTAMGRQKLGTTVDIVVERKGKRLTVKAKLE